MVKLAQASTHDVHACVARVTMVNKFLFVCRCIQISVVHEKEDESSRSVCSLETGMVTDYFSGINLGCKNLKNHQLYSFLFQT